MNMIHEEALILDIPQNNRRRSDGNAQTHSRLFELELSPIIEDTHVVDAYFGPPVPVEGDQVNEPLEYDSETSDSSFGRLLEDQVSYRRMN
jgi:hypothetical protein